MLARQGRVRVRVRVVSSIPSAEMDFRPSAIWALNVIGFSLRRWTVFISGVENNL